jgi:hypothetical protein
MYRRALLASNRRDSIIFDRQRWPPGSDLSPTAAVPQFRCLLRSFAIDPGLVTAPLAAEHLARSVVEQVGKTHDRIFSPLVTLSAIFGQMLNDDHSCQVAVDGLIACCAARGLPSCSPTPAATARPASGSPKPSCPGWSATPTTCAPCSS